MAPDDKTLPAKRIHTDLTRPVGDGGEGLSGLDEQILAMMKERISPEDMGATLNVSPARVLQRGKEILASRNYLSFIEQKALLYDDMVKVRGILISIIEKEEATEIFGDNGEVTGVSYGDPRWSANLIRLFAEMRKMMEFDLSDIRKEKDGITRRDAIVFISMMELAFRMMFRKMEELETPFDEMLIREVMEEIIPSVFEKMNEQVIDPEVVVVKAGD